MRMLSYSWKLLREMTQFSNQNRMYWMVPLFVILALSAVVIGGSQAVAPLIYALF